jgi:hypothetical protein
MKRLTGIVLALGMVFGVAACKDADVVSNNLSAAADSFEILRRVVFYNGITDSYMLTIEGFCSLGNADEAGELTVVCKTGDNQYKKHFLGLSDNVTYFVEQLDAATTTPNFYRVIFKPSTIVPNVDIQ